MNATRATVIGNPFTSTATIWGLALALAAAPGCSNPMQAESEAQLRQALTRTTESELGGLMPREVQLSRQPSELIEFFSPERLQELETIAGPATYGNTPLALEEDLVDEPVQGLALNLRDALLMAVQRNLGVQVASIEPAIAESRLVQAEAAFDPVFFARTDLSDIDEPSPQNQVGGIDVGSGDVVREQTTFTTGIRKDLITGAQLQLQTVIDRLDDETPGRTISPNPSYATSVELTLAQPLLRGFGSRANLAEIRVAQNLVRAQIESYRGALHEAVRDTEQAYWNLVFARYALAVRQRLLDEGIETRDKLRGRAIFDAPPAAVSDAIGRVELRKVDLLRARDQVLRQSDRLKQLINAPEAPLGSEMVVVPTDTVIDEPIAYNYVDATLAALRMRPEVRQALLAIEDNSIRQMLADNLRQPRLDVTATIRWNGLDNSTGDAYGETFEQQYVDYIVGLLFEQPIGNRQAQANYRRAQLERMQSVVEYRQVVQQVVLQVKEALRNVVLNYQLIEKTRDARLAAAENLRTIEVEEELEAALTPEFLNLKFNRQETLAQAELQEMQALIDYQIALSNLYYAMGLALERNQIEFVVPEPEDVP